MEREKPFKSLIEISCSKNEFKKDYTLRARIGIYFGVFIGLIRLKFIPPIK